MSPQFQYDLYFGPKKAGDIEVKVSGLTICFDRDSASRADGIVVGWVETPDGGAFRIENPNEPARVKSLTAPELKQWMDAGKKFELFDVRTDEERRTASVATAKPLDDASSLAGIDKATPIVLMCHHGMRSRNAAEKILRDGFTQVYNLEGGIDAWSLKVDTTVPRY